MPVLDTNFLIRLKNRDPAALAAFERLQNDDLVVPAMAAAEYLYGVQDAVSELVGLHRAFRVAHTSDAWLLEAYRLASAGGRSGRPRWADLFIAAHALLEGTYVVSTNKRDFKELGIACWNYEKEKGPPPV